MAQKFESNGRMYDVEIFQHEDTDIVRFYEERNEQYGERLSNLVIGYHLWFFTHTIYCGRCCSHRHTQRKVFLCGNG